MTTNPFKTPYALRIGVTGHQDLANEAGVRRAVDNLLVQIELLLGQQPSTPLDWIVISPLAKGADRTVARSLLDKVKARLEVITPFPLDEYRKDFADPSDLSEFEELLEKYQHLTELNPGTGVSTDIQQRNAAYSRADKAVVDSCEILIAVWDGKTAEEQDGTSNIIEYALEQGRTVLWINADDPSIEPTKLILKTAVDSDSGTCGISFDTSPVPKNARELSLGYHQLEYFCQDSAINGNDLNPVIQDIEASLKAHAKKTNLPATHLDPILEYIVPNYVRSDTLTLHYQKLHVLANKAIFLLSATAISVAVFQVLFYPHHVWMIGFEILAMIGALFVLALNRHQAWHEKWLHNRFITEQMRTAMYTLVLGEDPCARLSKTSRVLPFYVGPKNWLLAAAQQIITKAVKHVIKPSNLSQVKRFVIDGWLVNQRDWHDKNSNSKEASNRRITLTVVSIFWITLAMAVLHLIEIGHGQEGTPILSIDNWITFLAIILPAWGAAAHAIGKHMEYKRIAVRSKQMAHELNRLVDLAENTSSLEELRNVIQQATHIVSLENYEWWILLSFDAPELAA